MGWLWRQDEWSRVVAALQEWEERDDHDLGPGLILSEAWIRLFGDGSGSIIAELNTVVVDAKCGEVDLSKLMTNLGLRGRMQKPFHFHNAAAALTILSAPIKLNWRECTTKLTEST